MDNTPDNGDNETSISDQFVSNTRISGKRFHCDVDNCDQYFIHKNKFLRHQREVHQIIDEDLPSIDPQITAQLTVNSTKAEPLYESSTPQLDSLSPQSTSTGYRSLSSMPSTSVTQSPSNIETQTQLTSDCDQSVDTERQHTDDGQTPETQTHSLAINGMRHSLRKSHKCGYNNCNKSYESKQGLGSHIDAVHKNVKFVCDCGKSFKYKTTFYSHRKHDH